jgi:YfiH family protein
LVYYQFHNLAAAGVTHGIFTRLAGRSLPPFASLNVGHTVGDDSDAVESNHRLISKSLGLRSSDVITARQVHGSNVAIVGLNDLGAVLPNTDALITRDPGTALMLRFADCTPILLAEPRRSVVGIVHAGWRGTLGQIAVKAIEKAVRLFGIVPERLIAGIGPSIGPCCYEVGYDVLRRLESDEEDWSNLLVKKEKGTFMDLWASNRRHLVNAGVRNIEVARLCTACHIDEFFSHRQESGLTGRFAAVISV